MRLLAVLLAVVPLVGCAEQGAPPVDAPPDHSSREIELGEGWSRMPVPPLSPRRGPLVATVAGEVVVLGGYTGPPCPPNADCAYPPEFARDGVRWTPAEGRWREIAPAPYDVTERPTHAVVGDRLHVLAGQRLLVWDASEDEWTVLPTPARLQYRSLVADGSRLVMAAGSDENGETPDHVLDTRTGEWSTLPEDPLSPSFDRSVTATPHGLVLTASPIGPDGGPEDPAMVQAAVLEPGSDRWRRLPETGQIGGWRWSWTGRHLVDPTLGGADGGEVNNYGRVLPFGGRLDPVSGGWSPLPDAPKALSGGWPVDAVGGPVSAADGWLYDDATERWTRLPRPDGAPTEPGPATWLEETLVVYGGEHWDDDGWSNDLTPEAVYSTDAWIFTRPS
jgi:hypothetical protein